MKTANDIRYVVEYRIPDRTIGLNNWHQWDIFDNKNDAIEAAKQLSKSEVQVVKKVIDVVWYQELVP